ncbi:MULTISPECIES: sigma factor G inhibitor Gin [Carboxydothermus]|nr:MULTISPECIES: sigma factor G inhibitor Gin [Carboxydothermus]NYE57553.1 hypothetical protein [Carboxydothermus ferrireducens DSM 11255]
MYCAFCNSFKEKGIWLLGRFLCRECEKELTKILPVNPAYPFIVKRFRNFFLKQKQLW